MDFDLIVIGNGFDDATSSCRPEVLFNQDVKLDGTPFINSGYAIIDLDGAAATISYYQNSDEENAILVETIPNAGHVGVAGAAS